MSYTPLAGTPDQIRDYFESTYGAAKYAALAGLLSLGVAAARTALEQLRGSDTPIAAALIIEDAVSSLTRYEMIYSSVASPAAGLPRRTPGEHMTPPQPSFSAFGSEDGLG